MAIEDVAVSGVKTVMDGQGSVTTVLTLVLIGLCFVSWKFYNRILDLTERLISSSIETNKVISAFTEKLNDVIRTKN